MKKKTPDADFRGAGGQSDISADLSRSLPGFTRLLLCVRAGGRCEFDGHNEYLFEHPLTLSAGVFGEAAHIVAFSPRGPRSSSADRSSDIHDVENLMLLCPTCHKLIDDNPETFTEEVLRGYKRNHEERIHHVTSLGPDRSTAVVVFKAPIRGQLTAIQFSEVVAATTPRYPISRTPIEIDLSHLHDDDASFLVAGRDAVSRRVEELLQPGGVVSKTGHISLFAMGPMPLLIYLGARLSNKVPLDLYQRHRDTESWSWKSAGEPVQYSFAKVKEGAQDVVALVLSLSGKVPLSALPATLLETATIYELSLVAPQPSPTFLRLRQDLEGFRCAYQDALATIVQSHGILEVIDLFPAVPAPIAVLVGRELLPKIHPRLRLHDYDQSKGGFLQTIEVNHHGH